MTRVEQLRRDVHQLERQIDVELRRARRRWDYRIEAGRLRFERNALRAQKRLKQRIPAYIRTSNPLSILTAPFIYSLIVPIALLDLWMTVYQLICFPVYGISPVRRATYLVFDRAHLAYLNGIEKFNCLYCSYANGVFAYTREIAGRTEQYWCPIRHGRRIHGTHRTRTISDSSTSATRAAIGRSCRSCGPSSKIRRRAAGKIRRARGQRGAQGVEHRDQVDQLLRDRAGHRRQDAGGGESHSHAT
jgi:hypothetical protein